MDDKADTSSSESGPLEAGGSGQSGGRAGHYRLRDQIGTILRIANQNAIDVFNEYIVEEFGGPIVTTTQFAILATLWRNGPLSHSDIAARAVMDMPTLHSVLKRLERKRLIDVKVDDKDRRRRIVELTDAGRALAFKLRSIGGSISDRILEPLNDAQQAQLLDLLQAFNASRRNFPRD